MKIRILILAALLITINSFAQKKQSLNSLTEKEKKHGWQLLFDGKSLKGWKGYNSDQVYTCWSISNGELVCKGEGGSVTAGDIITIADFGNFDLCLDWCINKEGNSGIFYHVLEGKQYGAAYETGPEYQLIDDLGWPDKLNDWQQTGADYGMTPSKKNKTLKPVGEWNQTRIIYKNGHVEHWLNGNKVIEFQAYTLQWEQKKAKSKWKDYPGYAISKTGHIGLQNHGSGVKFRNIKVRRLD